MSDRTRPRARPNGSVGIWTLLLSLTATLLAALLGIHALGDDALTGGVSASSSITTVAAVDGAHETAAGPVTLAAADVADVADATVTAAVDATTTGLGGSDGALGCALLAALCVVMLVALMLRARGAAARSLDPSSPAAAGAPGGALSARTSAVSLTALGVSRV